MFRTRTVCLLLIKVDKLPTIVKIREVYLQTKIIREVYSETKIIKQIYLEITIIKEVYLAITIIVHQTYLAIQPTTTLPIVFLAPKVINRIQYLEVTQINLAKVMDCLQTKIIVFSQTTITILGIQIQI